MRLLDIEFERAIKDMPNEAIEELKVELKNARFNQLSARSFCLDTDQLTTVTNAVRQKYGLDKTTEIDDDKAIEDIEDPKVRSTVMQKREIAPGKKEPVRLLSKQGMESVLDKAIKMRKIAKYAETLKSLPREKIAKVRDEVFDTYTTGGDPLKKDRRSEIDPKYGIKFWDKIYALNHAEAVLALRECFEKCSISEFRAKRDKIESINRLGDVYYNLYGEVGVAAEILGIDSLELQDVMTMSDIAEAIGVKEKELTQTKGINMNSIIRNASGRGVTRDSVLRSKNAERSLSNQNKINDGVTIDE